MNHLKLKTYNWIWVVLLCLGSSLTYGQTLEQLQLYKNKYPGNNVVQTANTVKVQINLVKNVPVLRFSYLDEYLALDKNGVHLLSEESIDFSSLQTIDDIEAYSLVPNGKSSKKITVTNFETKDAEKGGMVFHDDSKVTSFIYPGIVEGTLCHLAYDETVNMVTFPIGFFFYSGVPCENPTFIVETDTAIHMLIQTYNLEKLKITYTEKIEKGKRIMTWTAPSSYMVKDDEFAPNPRYYAPQILGQIAYYTSKKERVNVLGTLEDLHNDYQVHVSQVENEVPSEGLKTIADSLTKNQPTELDKVRAVYYWVQDNIKYIAFEEGMGGIVPRLPSNVFDKRYGDCKDMSSVMYGMLKSVGVPSYLTWVGSRDLPYKYSDFPSNFCDNHMILTYKNNDSIYFLDATNSFQSILAPTGFIQGKEAFVHLGPGKYELLQIPIMPSENNYMKDTSYVKLLDNKLVGHTTVNALGYYNSLFGNTFKEVGVKDYKSYFTRVFERGNNTFNVSNPKVNNQKNREEKISMEFDWTVQNYATKLENELYVNLLLNKNIIALTTLSENRDAPIDFDYAYNDNYVVCMEIPDGYAIKSLPKDRSFKSDRIDFSISYVLKDNKVWCTTHFQTHFILLYPEHFNEWKTVVAQKKAAMAETMVLIKK